MGNTCSCCFRGSSRERQEKQRLRKKGKRSFKTPVDLLEDASVTPKSFIAESSETSSTNVKDTDLAKPDLPLEICPGQAAVQEEADTVPTHVEPEAGSVVTDVHVTAAFAVDKSTLLHQQEVAARIISEVLADATKIVPSEYLDKITEEGDTFLDHHASEVVSRVHVNAPSEDKGTFLLQQGVAARFVSKLLLDATEIVDASKHLTEERAESTESQAEKLNATKTNIQSVTTEIETQANAKREVLVASDLIENQIVTMRNLEAQSTLTENQIVTKTDERDLTAHLTDSVAAIAVLESLVQNSSAEEVVNEASKRFSLTTEIDSQLDGCGHQVLPCAPIAKLCKRVVFMEKPESLGFSTEIPEFGISGHQASLDDTSAALHSSAGQWLCAKGEWVKSPLYERPRSVDRLTPLSDASEAWFTGEEDCYSDEEFEEKLARRSPMEMTTQIPVHSKISVIEFEKALARLGLMEMTVPEQDRRSLKLPMDVFIYSERVWKGQMAKSIAIRKGYGVLAQSFGCLRQVREDHYSALRATLYQVLMNTTQAPDWLQHETFLLIPDKLESRHSLIKGWLLPDICKQTFWIKRTVDLMRHYLGLLQKWWHAAASSPGLEGRRRVCDQLFQGGEDEIGIMEALKVLMLACAVELYDAMHRGDDVPVFCWFLFARDTSSCPRTLLDNHLSQLGLSGGMEQVEMFLLGYALQHTIKVNRLFMAGSEEFISYYPADHIQDWPCICLVTEDDCHYNVVYGDLSGEERIHKEGFCKVLKNTLPSVTAQTAVHSEISVKEFEEALARLGLMERTAPEHDQCSFKLPMDITAHSESAWKGHIANSITIRKGYTVLSQSFRCIRQVRGDHYCTLRATLYQVLINTTHPPDWLQHETFLSIPEELESLYGQIKDWHFPDVCKQTFWIKNAVDLMKRYLGLLQKWWYAVASSPGLEGRRRVCDQLFQGGEDEVGIMEALKVLMLARTMELHTAMQRGEDVPFFAWLLFARDTSSCPHTFLANHLSQVGFGGGLDQVDMCLLGYTLQHTIKVYRLHLVNTEEFITSYPADHIQNWPCICLITEDDQHYNVAVDHTTHPLWRISVIGQPAFLQQLDC